MKSQGQRGLGGYNPWAGKELDMTEKPALSFTFPLQAFLYYGHLYISNNFFC